MLDRNADPNRANKFGMSPLHHASVGGEHKIVAAILKCGGDANKAERSGRVPLHWAAGHGYVEVARELLENGGAKAEVADKEGWTPLHRWTIMIWHGNMTSVKMVKCIYFCRKVLPGEAAAGEEEEKARG